MPGVKDFFSWAIESSGFVVDVFAEAGNSPRLSGEGSRAIGQKMNFPHRV
jgi:hypothetical protein